MLGTGVEEGGRGGYVVERGDEAIELDGLVGRDGEAAGDPEEEVLRGLDDAARDGIAEEVKVVDGAEAEVLEAVGEGVVG